LRRICLSTGVCRHRVTAGSETRTPLTLGASTSVARRDLRFLSSDERGLTAGPRHLVLMLFKILLTPRCPAQSKFHGRASPLLLGGKLSALIKCHDDVPSEPYLRRHRPLSAEEILRTIHGCAYSYPLLG